MRMMEAIAASSHTTSPSSSSSSSVDTFNEMIIDLLMTWLTKTLKEGQ